MKKLILLASLILAVAASKVYADTIMSCAQQPNFGCAGGDTYIGIHDFTGATLNLPTGAVDAITEIATALKSGVDATLVSGTKGLTDECAKWNADGDLVSAGAACSSAVGDVGAVGPGCLAGQCLTNGVATETGVFTVFDWEGPTADAYDYVLNVPVADPLSLVTWTLPTTTGNLIGTGDEGTVTGGMISDTYLTWNETRTGNGSLAATPKSSDSALAVSNGIVMKRVAACGGVNEYTLASATFTFCDATNNSPALVTYEQ